MIRTQAQSQAIRKLVLTALKPAAILNPSHAIPPEYEYFGDVDFWRGTLDFATSIHARMPYLTAMERSSVWATLPDQVLSTFPQALTQERMSLANLDFELDESLSILKRAGIAVIVLKGMDLGRRLYPARTFRPMTDVDLLVPTHRFDEALGHLLRGPYQKVGPFPLGRIRLELGRSKESAVVEIHKALQSGDSEEKMAGIWNRALRGVIPGLDPWVQTLSFQDYFPYLVQHSAVQHLMESPIWLNDLHFLIESEEFRSRANWQEIAAEAARAGAGGALWLVLRILKIEWGTQVPDQAILYSNRLVGPVKQRLLSSLIDLDRLFSMEERSRAWTVGSRFILRDRVGDALSYGIRRFRSRGWTAER